MLSGNEWISKKFVKLTTLLVMLTKKKFHLLDFKALPINTSMGIMFKLASFVASRITGGAQFA